MPDLEKKMRPEMPRGTSPESTTAPHAAETVESRPPVPEAHPVEPHVVASTPTMLVQPVTAAPSVVRPKKDELTESIEEVLSEDLEDLYKRMPPDRQQKFKQEGERTAGLIRQLIWHGKFHGRKILGLIVRWLKLIPGVNKFFLEQESKIKTDKLQMLAEEQNKKRV